MLTVNMLTFVHNFIITRNSSQLWKILLQKFTLTVFIGSHYLLFHMLLSLLNDKKKLYDVQTIG